MELRKAKKMFYDKRIQELETNNKKQWYRMIKRLGNADVREERDVIYLQEFDNKNDTEIANYIGNFLAKISLDCPLIKSSTYRNVYKDSGFEVLTLKEVEKAINKAKIPAGLSPLDFPKPIISNFGSTFSVPLTKIYNLSLKTQIYPTEWKTETVTMIPKNKAPESINDLRPISITFHFSKVFEAILRDMILNDIKNNLL